MAKAQSAKKKSSKAKPAGAVKSVSASGVKSEDEKKKILEERIARARVDILVEASSQRVREVIAATPQPDEPPMPIAKLITEAKQAAFNAENDLEQLCQRNYDFTNVGLIRALIAEVERLYLLSSKPRTGKRSAAELEAEANAKDWREQALSDIELAMNGDPDTAAWVASVREGDGIDDLIDDATRIVAHVGGISEQLETVGVDDAEVAAVGNDHIKRLTPKVQTRRAEKHVASVVPERNRAAAALYTVLNRLYQFGKNVFRKQANQARAYTSTYTRVRKAVYRAKKTRQLKKELKKLA